jgi:DNA-binding NtrC family response regulator
LPSASVAYVAFATVSATTGPYRWAPLLVLPPALAVLWHRTEQRRQTSLIPTAVSAVQATLWGLALFIAARSGPGGHAGFDAAANLGVGGATIATLLSLGHLAPPRGLLQGHPAARSRDAAAFAALLWGIAVALPATRALLPDETNLDPLAIDYATTAAATGSLLLLGVSAARMTILRGLELGVGDRARGAVTVTLTGSLVAVAAAAIDVAPPDRVVPTVLALTALLVTWATATRDPATVTSALRGFLAIVILGVPTALFTLWIARRNAEHLGLVVLGGCLSSLLVGLIARAMARPLGPESSRWLEALHAAMQRALLPEPEAAMRATLAELRAAEPNAETRPELWRRDPAGVLHVDVAGYLHESDAEFPERILELCTHEPENTLRAETLRALEVRRPDLRGLLGWFDSHHAFSATALVEEDGAVGLLVMPRGKRRATLTLEEARSLNLLGARVTGLLSVSSAMARSHRRELEARRQAVQLESERGALEDALVAEGRRRTAIASSLAEPLRATAHGPAARFTIEELERLSKVHSRIVLVTPPGLDPQAWAAIVHLAGPNPSGTFVRVDCALSRSRNLATWLDEHNSPFVQADEGTLLLENPAALPEETQSEVARRLARKEAQRVVVATSASLASETMGKLDRALLRALGGPEVHLPGLGDRAEDLQSIVLSELASFGLSTRGTPLGIAPHALRAVAEHTWPGNELELRALLGRAAAHASGPVIAFEDLVVAGLRPPDPSHTPPPVKVTERRQRARRPPRSRLDQ